MLVLAISLLSLRLGSSDAGNDPSSDTSRQAYELLAEGFGPGFNGTLELVAQTGGPAGVAALKTLEDQLPHVADVTKVTPVASAHGIEDIQVIPAHHPGRKRPPISSLPCATTRSRPLSTAPRCGCISAASPRRTPTSPP
jgi:putative drug exporter of the RND superfamily